MKIFRFFLIFSILFALPVSAQTETKCDVYAFVTDPASGVNVRADAGRNFRIIKTVPKDEDRTMFEVVGAKGDWLRVAYAVNSKNENVFSGAGWVLASLLSIRVSGAEALKENRLQAYKSPSKTSRRIPFSDFGIELPLQSCQENWVKVNLPVTGTNVSKSIPGWLPAGAYCGNPWLECD